MTRLPNYIPLEEAARRYGVTEDKLRKWIAIGKINAIRIGNNLAICEDEMAKLVPKRREDTPEWKSLSYLDGRAIWVSEAARRYGVPQATISRWVQRGWVKIVGREKNRILIDEREVAFMAKMHAKFGGRGKRLPEYAIAK